MTPQQRFFLHFPVQTVIRTPNTLAVLPAIRNQPVTAPPVKDLGALTIEFGDRIALSLPSHEVWAVSVGKGSLSAFILVPHPPPAIGQFDDTRVDHLVGLQIHRAEALPVHAIRAGEMNDFARVLPVVEDPRHITQKHVVGTVDPDDFRCPVGGVIRVLVFSIANVGYPSVGPGRPAIGGLRHADVRTVDPSHAGRIGRGSTTLRIIHVPLPNLGIEAERRISRRVKHRITKKRPACGFAHRRCGGGDGSQHD